jgi:putative transcriptional regulator
LTFEWDEAKTVFDDAFAVDRLDEREAYGEERFVIIGMAEGQVLLFVANTERGKRMRIISARADPDAQPLTRADFKRMQVIPRVKIIRRALHLTQEEFAERYHIPLGTLRDWEQGRSEPDQPTRAYLTLIARDPEHVHRMLSRMQ